MTRRHSHPVVTSELIRDMIRRGRGRSTPLPGVQMSRTEQLQRSTPRETPGTSTLVAVARRAQRATSASVKPLLRAQSATGSARARVEVNRRAKVPMRKHSSEIGCPVEEGCPYDAHLGMMMTRASERGGITGDIHPDSFNMTSVDEDLQHDGTDDDSEYGTDFLDDVLD